jgi:hypothetical protein
MCVRYGAQASKDQSEAAGNKPDTLATQCFRLVQVNARQQVLEARTGADRVCHRLDRQVNQAVIQVLRCNFCFSTFVSQWMTECSGGAVTSQG